MLTQISLLYTKIKNPKYFKQQHINKNNIQTVLFTNYKHQIIVYLLSTDTVTDCPSIILYLHVKVDLTKTNTAHLGYLEICLRKI